jgi:TonB family protein
LAISGREEKTGGQKIAEVSLYSGFEEEGGKSTENRADDQLGAKSPGPASVSLRPAQSADELSEQRREREPDSSSQEEGLPVQAADESVRPAENIEVASLEPARGHSYWLGLIRARIEKLKRYPVLARRRGIEGKVVVAFTITKQGEVKEAVITRSSGFALLDKAALNSVRKAAPFPYLPDRIVVPIVYKLTD